MHIPFTLPELLSRHLSIRTGGILSDPTLLVDGRPAPQGKDGSFTVVGEDGTPIVLRLIGRGIDLVPNVHVTAGNSERTVEILPALRGWEYAWCLVPLLVLIVLFRGLASGLIGALVTYLNLRVYRGAPNRSSAVTRTAVVSILVLLAYYGVSYLALSPFRTPHP